MTPESYNELGGVSRFFPRLAQFLARKTRLTVTVSSCTVEDFETKASAPVHWAASAVPWTLRTTILTDGADTRIVSQVSNPFIPGILKSKITTSGKSSETMRIASTPLSASPQISKE